MLAQVAGAFAGAALTFVTYREAFDHFDGGVRQVTGAQATAGIFSTYPQPFLSLPRRLRRPGRRHRAPDARDLRDLRPQERGTRRRAAPCSWARLVALIGMSFGLNAGYAINPARDLGPRLFTALAGWGGEVFRAGSGWWWVPIVAPCLGARAGRLRLRPLHHPPPPREAE